MGSSFLSSKRVLIIGFWCVLFLSIWTQKFNLFNAWLWLIPTLIFLVFAVLIAHYLSDVVLPKAIKESNRKTFFIIATCMTLLLGVIMAAVFTLFPLLIDDSDLLIRESMASWKEVFYLRLIGSIPSAIMINATLCGLRFYQEHATIEKAHIQLKKEHLEAHIKLLQDQINPHLIFNVLNHTYILMQTDVALASNLLLKFSDVLRYQLYECNKPTITLDKEITYLKDYVSVEQIRWDDELDIQTNWQIHNGHYPIAPLLLIPLLENAFKHVSRLPGTKGYIYLSCIEDRGILQVTIKNSHSTQYQKTTVEGGIGIANVKARLQLQYPNQNTLIIQSDEAAFSVSLTLKLTTDE